MPIDKQYIQITKTSYQGVFVIFKSVASQRYVALTIQRFIGKN